MRMFSCKRHAEILAVRWTPTTKRVGFLYFKPHFEILALFARFVVASSLCVFLPLICCTDDASMLMSLARQKDDDLLQAFAGCFEGPAYTGELDDELFLVQVRHSAISLGFN